MDKRNPEYILKKMKLFQDINAELISNNRIVTELHPKLVLKGDGEFVSAYFYDVERDDEGKITGIIYENFINSQIYTIVIN